MHGKTWLFGHCASTCGVLAELQRYFQPGMPLDKLPMAGDMRVVGCALGLFTSTAVGKNKNQREDALFTPTADIGL